MTTGPTTDTTPAVERVARVVDARGSFCPMPLMELIRAVEESVEGDLVAVYSSDRGSRIDIPRWAERAGHRVVGVYPREGYDEIVVQRARG